MLEGSGEYIYCYLQLDNSKKKKKIIEISKCQKKKKQ